MSGQAGSSVTLRIDLKEMLVEIEHEELNLTYDTVAPEVQVSQESARYPVMPREAKMKVPDTRRNEDGSYPVGEWEWSDDSYYCLEYGFEEEIDNVDKLRWEDFVDQEEESSKLAHESLMLGRESRLATELFNASNFSGKTTGLTNEWDDATNATPWQDIETAAVNITKNCGLGKEWMTLILSKQLVEYAVRTADIQDNVKYTESILTKTADVKAKFLADYLGIKECKLVRSLYDTSGLAASASIGKFWSNEYALLGVLSKGNTLRSRGLVKAPVWKRYSSDYQVHSYNIDTHNKSRIRVSESRGLILDNNFGWLLSNMKTTVDSGGF